MLPCSSSKAGVRSTLGGVDHEPAWLVEKEVIEVLVHNPGQKEITRGKRSFRAEVRGKKTLKGFTDGCHLVEEKRSERKGRKK